MGWKIIRWMCAVAFLTSIGFFHFVLTSLQAQNFTTIVNTVRNEEYLGLDGELTILPLWCSTCALVGTSGHLLNQEYGSEIDENHTCIFRFGFSPNRGMERFVGSRTTARIVDSFSFFPFLKRPWKLMTGPFASEAWILFDRRPGDISWFHRPLLSNLVQKQDTKFLWMTKNSEKEIHETLKRHNRRTPRVSALWFALKVLQDAGCRSLDIYGIPDHQICKRNMDVAVPSLYWDNASASLCAKGVDVSFASNPRGPPVSNFPTVPERRALLDWKSKHVRNVRFRAPQWPT